MGISTFSDDFKRDAVVEITERVDPDGPTSERLGVSIGGSFPFAPCAAVCASS